MPRFSELVLGKFLKSLGRMENDLLVFFEWNTHANGSTFIRGSELDLKMGFILVFGGFSCIETMFQMDF